MLVSSPKIVTDGLGVYYDLKNPKSWKGGPTVNYFWHQNPRVDNVYSPYLPGVGGNWDVNHPNSIRVYNINGDEITGYINGGVTDYTNTFHAVWEFDDELKKPVVVMRDYDGAWKAKSFGVKNADGGSISLSDMGLSNGGTYTISWLQWTDVLAKSANVGIYRNNGSGSPNFYDGLSNSVAPTTSFNTKLCTWERVYCTFTVSSNGQITAPISCYMYGYTIARGTLKIADVQFEIGSTPTAFSDRLVRWSQFYTLTGQTFPIKSGRKKTEVIFDLVGSEIIYSNLYGQGAFEPTTFYRRPASSRYTTITAQSLTYNTDLTCSFNGTSDYLTIVSSKLTSTAGLSQYTFCFWARRDAENRMPIAQLNGTSWYWYGDNSWKYTHGGVGGEYYYPKSVSIPLGTWGFYCVTYDGTKVSIYRNGVFEGSQATSGVFTGFGTSVTYRASTWNDDFYQGIYIEDPGYNNYGTAPYPTGVAATNIVTGPGIPDNTKVTGYTYNDGFYLTVDTQSQLFDGLDTTVTFSNNGIRVGAWDYSADPKYWQGKVDSLAIYTRALNAAEILQNFNSQRWRYGL